MGDEGGGDIDPCQEIATRCLLNIVRSTQAYCTDNACFVTDSTPRQQESTDQGLLMGFFIVAALFLYLMLPSRRQITEGPSKSSGGGNDPNGAPPTPPPAMT